MKDKRKGLGFYKWKDGCFYKGQWDYERMNGIGRISKDGEDVIGVFRNDQFIRKVERSELGELSKYIL